MARRAKTLRKGARLFETKEEPDKSTLSDALEDSHDRIADLFRRVHAGEAGVRAMKRGIVPYLGYFISHEAHHRGNILLTLKQCGHAVDKKVAYAIWDWDRIRV